MLITVDRIRCNRDATLSVIYLDGEFECFGLEDEYRQDKIAHVTRIPWGIYPLKLRTHGGFYERYVQLFGENHKRGMLEICNVPSFSDILIHIGNTHEDTSGCLLVGQVANCANQELQVFSSKPAYLNLYHKVAPIFEEQDIYIQFRNLDGN